MEEFGQILMRLEGRTFFAGKFIGDSGFHMQLTLNKYPEKTCTRRLINPISRYRAETDRRI